LALAVLCLAAPALGASDHSLGEGADSDNDRLLPGLYPAEPVLDGGDRPLEPYDPFFDADWSVALRGTYANGTAGERFDIRLLPAVGLEHIGSRSAINLDASAEIVRPTDGENVDIGGLRLDLEAGYDLDSVTRFTANANLGVTQPTAGSPGLAADIAVPSQTVTGGGQVGLTRQFGRFTVGVTGAAQRNVFGPTTLVGGVVRGNSEQNYWALDSALRVGFEATPILGVFGEAAVGRDAFDLPSTTLSAYPDATDTVLRAGATGRWSSVLEATASAGVGLRRFDAAGLGEVVTQLYDANITYTPDPTWQMTAGFSTTVAPPGPNGTGTTRVDYAANARVAYTVNSWLALRALADWNSAYFAGSPETETGYGVGAGADYKVNAHTALSADYSYGYVDSTANGAQDAHRVGVGVTLSR